jgi:hypothetical protein
VKFIVTVQGGLGEDLNLNNLIMYSETGCDIFDACIKLAKEVGVEFPTVSYREEKW